MRNARLIAVLLLVLANGCRTTHSASHLDGSSSDGGAGSSSPAAPSRGFVRIQGSVVDADGAAVADATVVAFGSRQPLFTSEPAHLTRTNPEGRFELELSTDDSWSLTATSQHRLPAYAFVEEPKAGTLQLVLTTPAGRPRALTGQVKTHLGVPSAGALARIFPSDRRTSEVYVAAANADGNYALGIGSGAYMLIADAPGATYVIERVERGEGPVRADIKLRPATIPPPAGAAVQIKQAAVPLPLGAEESAPVVKVLCGARVVGVGEATHGSAEFTRVRSELLFFLASKCEFNMLLLEADTSAVAELDVYVTTGRGDPRGSLHKTGKWPWKHEAVLDLVEKIRAHNATSKKPIRLVGVDPFFTSGSASDLLEFIRKRDEAMHTSLAPTLQPLVDLASWKTYTKLEEAKKASARQAIAVMRTFVESQETRTPRQEWLRMMLLLQALEAAETRLHNEYTSEVEDHRDRTMASLSLWAIDVFAPRSRALLAAHNGHIMLARPIWKTSTLGDVLENALGKDYVSVGLFFGHGSFYAIDGSSSGSGRLKAISVGPPPPGHFESVLALLSMPMFILDPSAKSLSEPVRQWLNGEVMHREIGTRFTSAEALNGSVSPALTYDLVIYVDEVTAIRPLK